MAPITLQNLVENAILSIILPMKILPLVIELFVEEDYGSAKQPAKKEKFVETSNHRELKHMRPSIDNI